MTQARTIKGRDFIWHLKFFFLLPPHLKCAKKFLSCMIPTASSVSSYHLSASGFLLQPFLHSFALFVFTQIRAIRSGGFLRPKGGDFFWPLPGDFFWHLTAVRIREDDNLCGTILP